MSLLLRRRTLLSSPTDDKKLYLYDRGSSPVTFARTFKTYNNPGTFEYADGYLKFTMNSTSGISNPRRGHCVSQTLVDMTGYTKLCCSYACNYQNGNIRLCLWEELNSSLYDVSYVKCSDEVELTGNSSGVLELPVTDWQGEYYAGIFLYKGAGKPNNQTITVDQIWLE